MMYLELRKIRRRTQRHVIKKHASNVARDAAREKEGNENRRAYRVAHRDARTSLSCRTPPSRAPAKRTMADEPRSPLSTVNDAPNAPVDGFMSHAPRPAKLRNVATHHPTMKSRPSTGVEAIMMGDENAPFATRAKRAWNENRAAQHAGANLFSAASPAKARSGCVMDKNGKLADIGARYETIAPKTLTLQELRQACRARGVNPGGSKDALVERLEDAIARGAQPVTLDSRPTTQRGAVGAGARFASTANEVRAPTVVNRELRESQKIWRAQQSGHDIFGAKFVDAEAKKRKVVEGPKATFSFEAITESFEAKENATVQDELVEERPKRVKRAEHAPFAEDDVEPVASVLSENVEKLADHRKSAWSSFQGAGLFSESWTTAAEEGEDEAALVKSTTTENGAWKSIEDEEERDETEGDDDEDDEEARALREADEAVAAAERELAEELAREAAGYDSQ